jgi:7-cyano-7-deazaguanine synthase
MSPGSPAENSRNDFPSLQSLVFSLSIVQDSGTSNASARSDDCCFVDLVTSDDLTMDAKRKAVILLSGGLDSATTLAEARQAGFELNALTINYGQRHAVEIEAARRVARAFGAVRHVELAIDLRGFGGSALLADGDVPKDRTTQDMAHGIPSTYVPARNTVFLSLALAWAETLGAFDLFIGANCVDYSGYPDCRPEYLRAFEVLANLATRAGVLSAGRFRVHSPLLTLTKEQIIARGLELGVDYGLTHSCYDPTPLGLACGRCDACQIRRTAFERLGLGDPVQNAGSH